MMTKQSYLKQEIRTRMELTGESYSAAARAIAKGQSLPGFQSNEPKVDLRALVIFAERLSVLLTTGMSFEAALSIVAQQTDDSALKRGILEVLEENNRGVDIFTAVERRPWAFPGIFSAMIRSGGELSRIMGRMANLYRTEMELQTGTIDQ